MTESSRVEEKCMELLAQERNDLRAEVLSLRERLAEAEKRDKWLCLVHGHKALPVCGLCIKTTKCNATPCGIIRAINEERSRTCGFILESGIPEGVKSSILDRIHGAKP